MRAMPHRSLIAMLTAALLSGCAVGPNYHRPVTAEGKFETPPLDPVAGQTFAAGQDVPVAWWTSFRSDALNQLMTRALAANPDLAAARATFRIAEETYKSGIGALFPTITGGAGLSNAKDPTGTLSPTLSSGKDIYRLESAQLNMTYTLDLLGGTRRQIESLSAQARSERFAAAAAYVGLTANVAQAAITEASLEDQVRAAEAIVKAEQETLGIFQRQLNAGQIAQLDLVAQQAALGQAQQNLEGVKKQLALQRDLLANLCGDPDPGTLPKFTLADFTLPAELPLSVSSKLVAQRADIRSAEENLHSASAQIGVATANMLPNISLSADWGSIGTHTRDLFQPSTTFWDVGANVTQTIFDAGSLLHKRRAAVAGYEQALDQYKSAVLTGFHAVGDALASIDTDARALTAAEIAEHAAAETLRIVTKQVDLGEAGYLALLSSQQVYQQAEAALIQAQASRFGDTVSLYQALGGDWWSSDNAFTVKEAAAAPSKASASTSGL